MYASDTEDQLYQHVSQIVCQAVAQLDWAPIDYALHQSDKIVSIDAASFTDFEETVRLLRMENQGFVEALTKI
jgi:hypothetical protein